MNFESNSSFSVVLIQKFILILFHSSSILSANRALKRRLAKAMALVHSQQAQLTSGGGREGMGGKANPQIRALKQEIGRTLK
jgi:hypothetical protein